MSLLIPEHRAHFPGATSEDLFEKRAAKVEFQADLTREDGDAPARTHLHTRPSAVVFAATADSHGRVQPEAVRLGRPRGHGVPEDTARRIDPPPLRIRGVRHRQAYLIMEGR